jgi:hypothetical protein
MYDRSSGRHRRRRLRNNNRPLTDCERDLLGTAALPVGSPEGRRVAHRNAVVVRRTFDVDRAGRGCRFTAVGRALRAKLSEASLSVSNRGYPALALAANGYARQMKGTIMNAKSAKRTLKVAAVVAALVAALLLPTGCMTASGGTGGGPGVTIGGL